MKTFYAYTITYTTSTNAIAHTSYLTFYFEKKLTVTQLLFKLPATIQIQRILDIKLTKHITQLRRPVNIYT